MEGRVPWPLPSVPVAYNPSRGRTNGSPEANLPQITPEAERSYEILDTRGTQCFGLFAKPRGTLSVILVAIIWVRIFELNIYSTYYAIHSQEMRAMQMRLFLAGATVALNNRSDLAFLPDPLDWRLEPCLYGEKQTFHLSTLRRSGTTRAWFRLVDRSREVSP